MFDITPFAQGLALGLGMFVCPGPKDLLILRQAIHQRPAAELLAVGVASDALLIWLGMAGISAALNNAPGLQAAALWLGVSLMAVHGLVAARRVLNGATTVPAIASHDPTLNRSKSLAALLAVSLFNPAAWLDTVLVIGTAGAALPPQQQWSFAAGAVAASAAWFLALVLGARRSGRWMASQRMWQALDAFIASAMLAMAGYVAAGLIREPPVSRPPIASGR